MSILDEFFDRVLSRRSVFKDKRFVSIDYIPQDLPHREDQILRLADILVNLLKGHKSSNVFEYGPVGTGKTAVTKLVVRKLLERASKLGVRFGCSYVNCRLYRTNYRALIKIASDLGLRVPKTGLPLDMVFSMVIDILNERYDTLLVVFDEIDWLVKISGDDIIYHFTRLSSDVVNANVSIVGITNDIKFREYLDARVLSSLCEETIVFQPYDQEQLYDILLKRAQMAFHDGCIQDEAIRLAASYAARDGDARRAIDMMRIAGEIADREGSSVVTVRHIQQANDQVEKNIIREIIRALPPNQRLLLFSLAILERVGRQKITTGLVKKVFDGLMKRLGRPTVTLRRMNDYIAELETLGLISSTVVSLGRHGRTRLIKLGVPRDTIELLIASDTMYRELLSEATMSLLA